MSPPKSTTTPNISAAPKFFLDKGPIEPELGHRLSFNYAKIIYTFAICVSVFSQYQRHFDYRKRRSHVVCGL